MQRGLDNVSVNETGKEVSAVSIPARQALQWITVDGARALNMADRIGSLTPGKQADIIFIRTGDLNLFPSHDPVETVLFQSHSANIDTVLVAGKPLKRAGRLLYPDLAGKKAALAASGKRLLRD